MGMLNFSSAVHIRRVECAPDEAVGCAAEVRDELKSFATHLLSPIHILEPHDTVLDFACRLLF